jgi:hypothetical protein
MVMDDVEQLVSQLYLVKQPQQAPERFIRAYRGLSPKLQGSAVPWHLTLPEKLYNEIERDQKRFQDELNDLDLSYLENVYIPTQKVFEYLQPAKINVERYEQYSKLDATKHIASFKPNNQGYAQVVEYDRVSNLTGRFKTINGPTLLHLPKIYRSVLESKHSNGAIYSLDYKSLEPRVLLATSGTLPIEEIEKDIYEQVRCSLFVNNPEVTRDVVKKIVLSELYGAGLETLRQRIPNVMNLENVVDNIAEWFGLKALQQKLFDEWKQTGYKFITNFYGRRVKTESTHTLVNHYVQSTAVDVAILGFKNILDYVNELDKFEDIVPLFILHDALILDVNENSFRLINGLCKIGSVDIKNLESTTFHMSSDKEFSL